MTTSSEKIVITAYQTTPTMIREMLVLEAIKTNLMLLDTYISDNMILSLSMDTIFSAHPHKANLITIPKRIR